MITLELADRITLHIEDEQVLLEINKKHLVFRLRYEKQRVYDLIKRELKEQNVFNTKIDLKLLKGLSF